MRFSFAPIFRQYNWNLIELRSLVGQVVYAEKNYISRIAPTWFPVMKFEKFSSREPFLKKEWSDLSHFWGFYVQNKLAVRRLLIKIHPRPCHPLRSIREAIRRPKGPKIDPESRSGRKKPRSAILNTFFYLFPDDGRRGVSGMSPPSCFGRKNLKNGLNHFILFLKMVLLSWIFRIS